MPAAICMKYGIDAGKEVEMLDFGKELVIVSTKKSAKGFIKFKRSVPCQRRGADVVEDLLNKAKSDKIFYLRCFFRYDCI